MEETHHSLIERLKLSQDEHAWELFEETYKNYIMSVLVKIGLYQTDAEDLRQEVLVKLWVMIPEFNYQPEKAKFRTWLYTVIKNLAMNKIRSLRAESKRIDTLSEWDNTDDGSSKLDSLMELEWKKYLTNLALQRVSEHIAPQSVEIFKLSLKGKPINELCEIYELKANSINRIKNRVKESLILEIEELRKELE